jgi:hypothetical protein
MCDETVDFHAGEPLDVTGGAFGYVVHFESLRKTLNLMLRKPIQHKFSNNGTKLVIQVPGKFQQP